jgi:hypothetical protein
MTPEDQASNPDPVAEDAAVEAPSADLNIYQRINLISQEAGALAPEAKGGVPFAFRGIDGTVAHLSSLLHKYGVIVVPTTIQEDVQGREVGNRVVKTTRVVVSYTFYAPDGSSVTATTPGLADDFADRSTAQAMSVAFRIALLQTFHLPTHSKEPEETGQDVLNAVESGAAARGPKAVEAAKAANGPAAPTAIGRLQATAKALGRKLELPAAALNAKGAELSGGKDVEVWFNDVLIMEQIVDWLQGQTSA